MDKDQIAGICLRLISNAGEGRACLSEALKAIVLRELDLAEEKIAQAETFLAEAHKIQFEELMAPQQRGEEIGFNLLLVHAMDILMIASSEKDSLEVVVAGLREGGSL